jgi:3-phenylpropionate/cinnamic acid dioxygenase small subunit
VVGELERLRQKYRDAGTTPWHVITNVLITEEGPGSATAKSFFTMVEQGPDGEPRVNSIGHYVDRFEPDGEAWRIKHRQVLGGRGGRR